MLTEMASCLPKECVVNTYQSAKIVEYTCTDYTISRTDKDLAGTIDEPAKAQTALDVINNQAKLGIHIG